MDTWQVAIGMTSYKPFEGCDPCISKISPRLHGDSKVLLGP